MSARPILCLAISPAVQRTLFMDILRPGEVNRAKRTRISAAGKGVNVATVLARLGAPARLVGMRGGPDGEWIARELAALGVDARWTETRAPTRHCHTVVEGEGTRITELVEETATPAESEWRAFDQAVAAALTGCSWLAISGALPPGVPVARLAELGEQARAAGAKLFIDSQGAPLRAALDAKPAIVKLNVEELTATTGRPADEEADRWIAMQELRSLGAGAILVTDGARDAFLRSDAGRWRLTPPRVDVLNPIGSGDAVSAGLLVELERGAPLPDAAAFGLACGSANALTEIPALLDPATARELCARVVQTAAE
ncbi:MAG TPA: hexose kinase [Kiritimatiellia bacterium]|nr:hexose kinase [Kiritimatiellia bacterium]